MKLNIGLDCDGVIDRFWEPYVNKFGYPKTQFEITKNVQRKLINDRNFWINLPVLHRPNFEPTLFCTKRTSSKRYLRTWLENNNFPIAPIYQVLYQYDNKARFVKGKIDVFVDDSIDNFISMNLAGVPCLLMDNPANIYLGPMLRIHSLDYAEIEDAYNLALEMDIFKDFKLYYEQGINKSN